MSAFEQAKETMMLLITVIVLIFVSLIFYALLGNYKVGSEVDISNREVELVALRALKCIENNENLDDCVKTDKYALMIGYKGKTYFVNKQLFEKWSMGEFLKGEFEARTLVRWGALYPRIQVVFKT